MLACCLLYSSIFFIINLIFFQSTSCIDINSYFCIFNEFFTRKKQEEIWKRNEKFCCVFNAINENIFFSSEYFHSCFHRKFCSQLLFNVKEEKKKCWKICDLFTYVNGWDVFRCGFSFFILILCLCMVIIIRLLCVVVSLSLSLICNESQFKIYIKIYELNCVKWIKFSFSWPDIFALLYSSLFFYLPPLIYH